MNTSSSSSADVDLENVKMLQMSTGKTKEIKREKHKITETYFERTR